MLRTKLRTLFRETTGFDIHRVPPKKVASETKKFAPDKADEEKWIQEAGIRTVIDIGAHSGDFSRHFRELLPNAFIYAFEPLPVAFSNLIKSMEGDANFKAFQCALGEDVGYAEMSENEFTYSSSLLAMAERHRAEFPFTERATPLRIEVKRLDDFSFNVEGRTLIKIDVQGFEDRVIRGGKKTIAGASVVIMEVSFVELYKRQPLFPTIYSQMIGLGFSYAGSFGQLRSPANGLTLQQDAIFLKSGDQL